MNLLLTRYKTPIVIAASLLALWPVFFWYTLRMADGSDDNFGLLAMVTALGVVYTHRANYRPQSLSMVPLTLLMLAYLVSIFILPPILRAVLAMTLAGFILSQVFLGRDLNLGLWGLLMLSLPVMASVQFYLGYPLRWVVGEIAEGLLQLNGLAVTHSGTQLNWPGGSVLIDAPCSGVKMLWFGFYLCFTLACLYRLSCRQLAGLVIVSLVVIVCINALRASALFYIESGLITMPDWAHDGVGIVMYLIGAISIVFCVNRINGRATLCEV